MPGDKDQPQPGEPLGAAAKCIQGQLFLGLLGAAGQEHDVACFKAGQLAQPHGLGILAVGLGAVELDRARHLDHGRRRTERQKPLGVVGRLRRHQIEPAEQRSQQRTKSPITTKTPLAEPAVDDRHARARIPGGPNQIGPQLEFGQHQQSRADAPHCPTHRPTEIQRTIKDRQGGES